MRQTAAPDGRMTVTPRERVLAALALRQPDRVPFMESGIDLDMQVRIMGREDFTPAELATELGLDGFGVRFLPPLFVETQRPGTRDFISLPQLTCPDDLALMEFPDPTDSALYEEAKRQVDLNRGHYAVAGMIRLGASATLLSMGLEGFAYALHDHPGLVETILDRYVEWSIRVVEHLADVGVDLIWNADDLAYKTGPMFSPKVFTEVFLPRLAKVADAINSAGLPWIFHSDGNLMPILDDLLTLGMNGLHPIEPGAMDINYLKEHYGERLCLVGNIDLRYTLTRGTPEEVDAEVRDRIERVGRGGGYIVSSANSITSYCKLENVFAVRDAIARYGHYAAG